MARRRNPDGDPREQDRVTVEDLPLFSSDPQMNELVGIALGKHARAPEPKDDPPPAKNRPDEPDGPTGAGYVPYADPRTAPETSLEAAHHQSSTGKAEGDRQRVWEALLDEPDTDDGLEVRLGLPHQTVSARRRGLVLDGWIRASGRREKTRSGRQATVWEPVPIAERPQPKPDTGAILPERKPIPPKIERGTLSAESDLAKETGSRVNKLAPKIAP